MPVTNGEVRVSEPWTLKTRNKGRRGEPAQAAPQNTLSTRNAGAGVGAKDAPPERPIVDVVKRNKSSVNDRPFGSEKVNLSQKVGRGKNPASGGREMGTFSQDPNQSLSRNDSTPSKTMEGLQAKIGGGSTKVRKYPAKGANARGANAG